MKIKLIVVLCAATALAGCDQGQEMNEPSGAERPAYESPDRSTNAPSSTSTNQQGTTNGANLPDAGTSTTP